MSTILVTGSGGYLGSRLVQVLAADHDLISMSRSPAGNPPRVVQGDFTDAAALTALDGERIDVVVHLAAVTGGCSEEDAMNVNVSGTRRLVRWAVDHGVRRFVLASSIAAVGCLSPRSCRGSCPFPTTTRARPWMPTGSPRPWSKNSARTSIGSYPSWTWRWRGSVSCSARTNRR